MEQTEDIVSRFMS